VTARGAADRLVGVDSPLTDRAERYESRMENGVMTMRQVDPQPVVGKPPTLIPGGLHILPTDLRQTLTAGDRFPGDAALCQGGVGHSNRARLESRCADA